MNFKIVQATRLGVTLVAGVLIVTGCSATNGDMGTPKPVTTLEVVIPQPLPELTPDPAEAITVESTPGAVGVLPEVTSTLTGVDKYFPRETEEIITIKSRQMTDAQAALIDRASKVINSLNYQAVGVPVSEEEIMKALGDAGIKAVSVNLQNITSPVDAPRDTVIIQFYNGQLESITMNVIG